MCLANSSIKKKGDAVFWAGRASCRCEGAEDSGYKSLDFQSIWESFGAAPWIINDLKASDPLTLLIQLVVQSGLEGPGRKKNTAKPLQSSLFCICFCFWLAIPPAIVSAFSFPLLPSSRRPSARYLFSSPLIAANPRPLIISSPFITQLYWKLSTD